MYYLQQLLYEVPLEGHEGVSRWWWVCRHRVPKLYFLPRDGVPFIVDNVGAEGREGWGSEGGCVCVLVLTIRPARVRRISFVQALVK